MAEAKRQIVLAHNQHCFLQDIATGAVTVLAGPHMRDLSDSIRPVSYDKANQKFYEVSPSEATAQNPTAAEGDYVVLTNPLFDNGALTNPKPGQNESKQLQIGRKLNIPGPITFALWPGQIAEVIGGHHLRTNQYLQVRVYNADEAEKNQGSFFPVEEKFTNGQLLIVKGTETPFFIPPTGFEVIKDETGKYVREALTLERLEYCILLDESGEKEYVEGPAVVFPKATQTFVSKKEDNNSAAAKKFKQVELNDQTGLYIKVIDDYTEDGVEHKAGEELFITGKEQRIYYPRPEHALIEYLDPKSGFSRQRYYAIVIPSGEGRYVLDKNKGVIEKVEGPCLFLPDPRYQVIVRRVLDDKTVNLWYPGNTEAMQLNQTLRSLSGNTAYIAAANVSAATVDTSRGMNRGTKGSSQLASSISLEGDKFQRGATYTPPPTLTFDTKYEGIPSINVFTGYAVQVVDKNGHRRVVVGPATIRLAYDEILEVFSLSTGKPKTTDSLLRDVYLRVANNLVSDIINAETLDLVSVQLKVSYRLNFLESHKDKWFSVENYVKFLCDRGRSRLKATCKQHTIKELIESSVTIIRDSLLGPHEEGKHRAGMMFTENGMHVYDVEVLDVAIADAKIRELLVTAQQAVVRSSIELSLQETTLSNTTKLVEIKQKMAELETGLVLSKQKLTRQENEATAKLTMAQLVSTIEQRTAQLQAKAEEQGSLDSVAQAELTRDQAKINQHIEAEKERANIFKTKIEAIAPGLIAALNNLANNSFYTEIAQAVAPLAIVQQTSVETVMNQLFGEGFVNKNFKVPEMEGVASSK